MTNTTQSLVSFVKKKEIRERKILSHYPVPLDAQINPVCHNSSYSLLLDLEKTNIEELKK